MSSTLTPPNRLFCLLMAALALLPLLTFAQVPEAEVVLNTNHYARDCAKPLNTYYLDRQIPEGSGLTAWNGLIWTHNDSGTTTLFGLDSSNGKIVRRFDLPGVKNEDWEEISQDARHLYVGAFGNNSGNRERLHIYRISKDGLLQDKVMMDSIAFEWPATEADGNKINFDCEAMVIMQDSIFLFTKEWKERRCSRIFKIPAQPGTYLAEYVATIETKLLITGADYSPQKKRIVLCGYSLFLKPRLLLLSLPDSGNLRELRKGKKIRIRRKLQQTEGITSFNGLDYYVISEAMEFWFWKNKPKVYRIRIE